MARRKDSDSERDDGEHDAGDLDPVTVEITADHIYLPLDEAGNVPTNWREAPDTLRVGKGTKLAMPSDLVEWLGDRVARVA